MRTCVFIATITVGVGCWLGESLAETVKADRVLVLKKQRILLLSRQGETLKTYKVALGGSPVGPKVQQGDHKTPEGVYVLDRRNPRSKFYRSIHISYPDAKARDNAARLGVSPGGDVFVHGLPNGFGWLDKTHVQMDWTDGCIAVTDKGDGRNLGGRPSHPI